MHWARVPPATVNKHSNFATGEDNIGRASQGKLPVKAESATCSMEGTTQQ
jgi:hypothetical protein